MQKNWYAVYTKPQNEKKVIGLLNKKKIENFCPLSCVESQSFRKQKLVFEPLFKSYVFVQINQAEIESLKKLDGVVNLLFWLGKPAVIKDDEIEAIRNFISAHRNIKLERTLVNITDVARNMNGSSYDIEGNLVKVMNKTISINLPSLGFTMVAEAEDTSIFANSDAPMQNKHYANS